MLTLTAALAAFLFAQEVTQPPKPGEQPNFPLLVGPAAERYKELLKKEDQLTISRAQLAFIDAQLALVRLFAGPEPVDNLKRIEAEQLILKTVAELRRITAEMNKKYGHGEDCVFDAKQEAVCPAKK